jgi:hypothetical protein
MCSRTTGCQVKKRGHAMAKEQDSISSGSFKRMTKNSIPRGPKDQLTVGDVARHLLFNYPQHRADGNLVLLVKKAELLGCLVSDVRIQLRKVHLGKLGSEEMAGLPLILEREIGSAATTGKDLLLERFAEEMGWDSAVVWESHVRRRLARSLTKYLPLDSSRLSELWGTLSGGLNRDAGNCSWAFRFFFDLITEGDRLQNRGSWKEISLHAASCPACAQFVQELYKASRTLKRRLPAKAKSPSKGL